ncbi:tautomerase family protein [Rothia uropygialis]|uniref:tautomerase family protein n=1 Tax=Kocuria sp. 36 TaxID=1415402 RepID=UPI00101C2BEC|nr:tautomerase family protein [Kocuria sp. 36]
MPLAQLSIAEGRSPEQIRELIRSVTEAVSTSLDAPAENVRVTVNEFPLTHWGSGVQTLAEKRSNTQ